MSWASLLWDDKPSLPGADTGAKKGSSSRSRKGLLSGTSAILNLEGGFMPRSDWSKGRLVSARFARTNLTKANLTEAILRDADLRFAIMREADLRGADMFGAILEGADLRGADLTGALNLTKAQIDSAIIDETTKLPADLA
ncbi:pentapeptide repeat-containing protein [Magnetospirillum sp. SS-4]|uniref:pentapeptide repeat-containing protein n=1 Tax=Magnetospirillum sp. SS-4 TaxID=2681465 RepID=UPI001573F0D8|nr:pentapeptide repeat-containing protein [Magnetospirillum sp. SS-4]